MHTHTLTNVHTYKHKENRVLYIYLNFFVASVFSCFVLLFVLFNHVCCLLYCRTLLYLVTQSCIFFILSSFWLVFFFFCIILISTRLFGKPVCPRTCAIVLVLFSVSLFVFQSLCSLREHFLTPLELPGHFRSFEELKLLFVYL